MRKSINKALRLDPMTADRIQAIATAIGETESETIRLVVNRAYDVMHAALHGDVTNELKRVSARLAEKIAYAHPEHDPENDAAGADDGPSQT